MRFIALGLLFLLMNLTGRAAEQPAKSRYRLVQSQVADEVPPQGPVESATVYVLIFPDERLHVFRAFHSRPMEEVIKHFPRGSVLHYQGNALVAQPTETQIQALRAFCAAQGIELVIDPTS